MQKGYDLIIIGAGWAGCNAALLARKLGKTVALIEKDAIGGTCLNRGCIPTKVLTNFAKHSTGVSDNLESLRKAQQEIVSKLGAGLQQSLRSQNVELFSGTAKVISSNKVLILEPKQELSASFILVASGSRPKDLPFLRFDHKRVISSDDALQLSKLPQNLLVVGGGVIGCEFACAFRKLGAAVTIAELLDSLVPMFDKDIARKLQQSFQKAGISVFTSCDIKSRDLSTYDTILVSVGRALNTEDVFDSALSVGRNRDNSLVVNECLQTSIPNIYAAGDCIGGLQLAHVARYEARLAVHNMFIGKKAADYSAVPSSVFTVPELAQVGIGEDQAREKSLPVIARKKFFLSVGMAHIVGQTDGFIKLIIEQATGRLLGASIIGPQATELINTITVAVESKSTVDKLQDLIFAHPSISEIFTDSIQE